MTYMANSSKIQAHVAKMALIQLYLSVILL